MRKVYGANIFFRKPAFEPARRAAKLGITVLRWLNVREYYHGVYIMVADAFGKSDRIRVQTRY